MAVKRPAKSAKKATIKRKKARNAPAEPKPIDGPAARRMIYDSFIRRIGNGDALKPSEIKQFRALESELEAGRENGSSGEIIATTDEAATYCGVSKRVVSGDVKKGKLKRNADGTFRKEDLNRYIAKYRSGKRGDDPADGPACDTIREQQEKAELRYRLAKARKEEFLADQLEKTLIPKSEVEQRWGERVRIVTTGLESWKDRLPALLVGRSRDEIQVILDGEVRDLQSSFNRRGEYCPEVKPKTGRRQHGTNA